MTRDELLLIIEVGKIKEVKIDASLIPDFKDLIPNPMSIEQFVRIVKQIPHNKNLSFRLEMLKFVEGYAVVRPIPNIQKRKR